MTTRVLVLGGDGMLGRMLRFRLAADPAFHVEWTSRRRGSGAHFFEANSSIEALGQMIQRTGGYEYAINCIAVLKNAAAESGEPAAMAETRHINADFPHFLARIAAEGGFKLLHVSTDAVFPPDRGHYSEADTPEPADFYGYTKLAGEPVSPHALTFRCSLLGPDPVKKKGLFEWVVGQPAKATIKGYEDQIWNGATTLQFADLCAVIIKDNLFRELRDESPVHHFCPNAAVTKYELVRLICRFFRSDLEVERAAGGTISRTLETRGKLRTIWGHNRPMDVAIGELSTYIGGPMTADR